jgi:hypothetical protein
MAVRLALTSVVQTPWLAVANQAIDGLGNGLFAALAEDSATDLLAALAACSRRSAPSPRPSWSSSCPRP